MCARSAVSSNHPNSIIPRNTRLSWDDLFATVSTKCLKDGLTVLLIFAMSTRRKEVWSTYMCIDLSNPGVRKSRFISLTRCSSQKLSGYIQILSISAMSVGYWSLLLLVVDAAVTTVVSGYLYRQKLLPLRHDLLMPRHDLV